jgi:membrane AbrB-like protein
LSAFFASSPGALSQVIALSVGTNVNLPAIVIVQTIRVMLLAIGTPIALAAFGLASSSGNFLNAGGAIHTLPELAVLIAASAAATVVFVRIRFPGAPIFGSMAASAALHGSGLIEGRLPAWLVIITMLSIGAMTGSRFRDTTPRLLLRYCTAGLGAFAVTLSTTLIFASVILLLLPYKVADVVLAYSPGAQDAMMILVLSLAGDPVFVGAHHVSRFVMVSASLPLLMRIFGGAAARERPKTDAAPDD